MNALRPLSSQSAETYSKSNCVSHRDHTLEQYKIFVASTEHISNRRSVTNAFFVTLNSSLLGALGYLLSKSQEPSLRAVWFALPLAGMFLCFFWWALVRSYKQINKIKFEVISEIEELLPIAPFRREWDMAGRGQDPRRYIEVSVLEYATPWVYFAIYGALVALNLF